jgi:phosphoenolpyruvate---glycerone phosphotransferase subunit DhaL
MITKQHIITWLERSAKLLDEKKAYLTELDSPIGDADHGINMARGFGKVIEKLPTVTETDIGNILKTSGMTLLSTVGGASGPLYGTFFMRAGGVLQGKQELDGADLVKLLETGIEGVVQRGRAEIGDKTMIDALLPAVQALKISLEGGSDVTNALEACVAAAETGVQNTIALVARKGRASYLGERSVGHQDPGATSAYYLLATLLEVVKG